MVAAEAVVVAAEAVEDVDNDDDRSAPVRADGLGVRSINIKKKRNAKAQRRKGAKEKQEKKDERKRFCHQLFRPLSLTY